jgi:hypothetical protein
MNREQKIRAIINEELRELHETSDNINEAIVTLLRNGFKGYDNMSDESIDRLYKRIQNSSINDYCKINNDTWEDYYNLDLNLLVEMLGSR